MSLVYDYEKLYEEYKALYREDKQKAKERNDTFEVPRPKEWSLESVKLRAFLDRDKNLYSNSLAPFEFLLKKSFDDSQQEKYEALVACYRDEYFSYKHRSAEYTFTLGGEGESTIVAKEYVLSKNREVVLQFVYGWQAKLDTLKSKNIEVSNVQSMRLQEKELVQGFSAQLSQICSKIALYSQALNQLLSDYEPLLVDANDFKLQTYFDHYDLSDTVDVIEYVKNQKNPNPTNDVLQIRQSFQTKIAHNNRAAEIEMTQSGDIGQTLLKYAANEQNIVVEYRDLIRKYLSYIGDEGDFELVNRPFELYFDNYFADFENILKYYELLYNGKKEILTQTPYYLKMFNAAKEKMAIVKHNAAQKIEDAKIAYVRDRTKLMELRMAKLEYAQELLALLDEFERYGELYISKIDHNAQDLQKHTENVALLQERFNIKANNGLF